MAILRNANGIAGNGFNRAAPFRERLSRMDSEPMRQWSWLQSCRPLSGAVIW